MDGEVNFFRNWQNYKLGFGSASGEHWLGLENLHHLLSLSKDNELLIFLETFNNERASALYASFNIGDEDSGYKIDIGKYTGSTPPGMILHKVCDTLIQENI